MHGSEKGKTTTNNYIFLMVKTMTMWCLCVKTKNVWKTKILFTVLCKSTKNDETILFLGTTPIGAIPLPFVFFILNFFGIIVIFMQTEIVWRCSGFGFTNHIYTVCVARIIWYRHLAELANKTKWLNVESPHETETRSHRTKNINLYTFYCIWPHSHLYGIFYHCVPR